MAVKHVREYYERMVSDYVEMKKVLEEMEKISEENAEKAISNIDSIREQVNLLEANYKRLSYIMFLLNQPNKEKKKKKYYKSEHKRLDKIPEKDRQEGVIEENSSIIENLKSFT